MRWKLIVAHAFSSYHVGNTSLRTRLKHKTINKTLIWQLKLHQDALVWNLIANGEFLSNCAATAIARAVC